MKEFNFEAVAIVDIVNEIILDAINLNASDIHFDPSENYLRIRVRVDGELQDYALVSNKYKRNLITRVKLLAGMNITEMRLPQDGAIKQKILDKDVDLRVSSLPTNFGEKVVIRILDYSMSLKGIEALDFSSDNYKKIVKMLESPNGIILITGATGSGKTTTVYSMLQRINKEEINIITVEDPIEMNIEGINQVQVNPDIGLDFATVLRSILRQDPNVILIGEIRDSETSKIAIRASITGHLVLSTLHTNNSLTTIERLLDMNVERYLLSSSLKGIISQNLAKRLCPKCRVLRKTSLVEKRIFKKVLNLDVDEIYDSKGCDSCHNGYAGRVAIQEVLIINDDIREAINNHVDRRQLKKLIYKKDVRTLLQDGLLKVLDGITSISEVLRLVDIEDDPSNLYDDVDVVEVNNKKDVFNKLRVDDENKNLKNNTKEDVKPDIKKSLEKFVNKPLLDNSIKIEEKKKDSDFDINDIVSKYSDVFNKEKSIKDSDRTTELIKKIDDDILNK